MKNVKPIVNRTLKGEKSLQFLLEQNAQSIIELEEVLSCYKHFQASYEASLMPDAYIETQFNKQVIRKEIAKLYAERSGLLARKEPVITSPQPVRVNYIPSELEARAIEAFYSDNRYTIKD